VWPTFRVPKQNPSNYNQWNWCRETKDWGSSCHHSLNIFATVALVSVLALQGSHRKLLCGVAASVFSIIMYGSPLSIMVGDYIKECGIRALLAITLLLLVWYFLVHLRINRPGSFRC
ncbi:Bidirectional sugar transporter SWEET1, partial [Bienertia sinuspersici]